MATYTITGTAADTTTDTATVDITVNAVNPPIIANQSAQTYTTTVAITALSFTNTGGAATSCDVSPTLPTGLSVAVNASTCRITGTATVAAGSTVYTVTATAADTTTDTATVNITVTAANPPILANLSAQTYTTTVAISPVSFTNTGGAATNCSSSPTLPTGLTVAVNGSTCRITGTPTGTAALATYTITGTAADTTTDTATVDITVNAAVPPVLADQSAQTYTQSVAISTLTFAHTGGAVVTCGVSPTLPTGLAVSQNGGTCRITGTASVSATVNTYTITGTAADASTDTATVDITVNAANPPILADQSAQTYTATLAITPISFTNIGAATTSCSPSPALPTGLAVAVNGSTCRITGTPTGASGLTTYTITGTAADFTTDTATIDITVNAANPPALADQ